MKSLLKSLNVKTETGDSYLCKHIAYVVFYRI